MFTRSAAFYEALYSGKAYAGEAEQIGALVRAHGIADGKTLLDVACGTGGHLAFLKHNFACEGLDLDPNLLAIARERHADVALPRRRHGRFRPRTHLRRDRVAVQRHRLRRRG